MLRTMLGTAARTGWLRRALLASSLTASLAVTVAASAVAAPPVVGTLTQLAGLAGCISSNGESKQGAGTCTAASEGVAEPESATVSPDGKSVYIGDYISTVGATPKIEVFGRNAATSALTQLRGFAGCLAEVASPCAEGRGLGKYVGDGRDIVITPDGLWAYAAMQAKSGVSGGAVLIFQRDPATGALTQLPASAGCITTDGGSQAGASSCQADATLAAPMGVSLSPGAGFLYVTDYGTPYRVHVFARNGVAGGLTDVQCIAQAPAPAGCSTGRVLGDSQSLAITPDGLHAYSGDYSDGISVFDRDPATGVLTQKPSAAGCITDTGEDDTKAKTCTKGRVLAGAYPLTVAANGATLYVPANTDGGISIFHINSDGTLTQLEGTAGCITESGKDNEGNSTCATGRGVLNPYGGQLAPDGLTFYTTSDNAETGGIAAFAVDTVTGRLTQLAGTAGCTTVSGTADGTKATAGQCVEGRALSQAYELAISPDGTSVYVASDNAGAKNGGIAVFTRQAAPLCGPAASSAAYGTPVAVSLPCSSPNGEPVTISIAGGAAHGTLSAINQATRTVTYAPTAGYIGTDTFTYQASDGTNTGAPATATITVLPPRPAKQSRPAITAARLTNKRFRVAKENTAVSAKKAPLGTTFRFTLSADAKLQIAVTRSAPGLRRGRNCLAPTPKLRRAHAKRCTRTLVLGTLTRAREPKGADNFPFSGRIGRRALSAGAYKAVLSASNAGGRSKPVTLSFAIVGG